MYTLEELKPFLSPAEEYIQKSIARPRWNRFLHGIAATMELTSRMEGPLYRSLLEIAPDPETARKKCTIGIDPTRVVDSQGKTVPVMALCHGAEHWEEVTDIFNRCEPWDLVKLFKGKGLQSKGSHMVMALVGCPNPVIDLHIMDLLDGVDTKWLGSYRWIKDPEEKAKRRELYESRRKYRKRVQANPKLYEDYAKRMEQDAKEKGLNPGLHHVAVWFKKVFETPEKAKEFNRSLYGD